MKILFFCLIIFPVSNAAFSQMDTTKWKYLDYSKNTMGGENFIYIDTKTIEFNDNYYSVWIKTENFPAEFEKISNKYITSRFDAYKIDCNSKQLTFVKSTTQYTDNTNQYYNSTETESWKEPVTGSIEERLFKEVCNK